MIRFLRRMQDSSGMALMVTLLVMVILAVCVHRFSFATRVHLVSAANLRDQLQAEFLAYSGVEAALSRLKNDEEPDVDHLSEPWALFRGSRDMESLRESEGAFEVKIQDESAKININALVGSGGERDPFVAAQLKRLLEIFGVPEEQHDALIDTLVDWLDKDDDPVSLEGAETLYYQALDSPYPCRNGPLRTLSELRWVKGWQDVWTRLAENGTSLADCLTVGPTQGVNINTAGPLVLRSLDPQIDEILAEEIITVRNEAPFESIESLAVNTSVSEALLDRISDHIAVNGGLFAIRSDGVYRKARSTIHALVERDGDIITLVRWRVE